MQIAKKLNWMPRTPGAIASRRILLNRERFLIAEGLNSANTLSNQCQPEQLEAVTLSKLVLPFCELFIRHVE